MSLIRISVRSREDSESEVSGGSHQRTQDGPGYHLLSDEARL